MKELEIDAAARADEADAMRGRLKLPSDSRVYNARQALAARFRVLSLEAYGLEGTAEVRLREAQSQMSVAQDWAVAAGSRPGGLFRRLVCAQVSLAYSAHAANLISFAAAIPESGTDLT